MNDSEDNRVARLIMCIGNIDGGDEYRKTLLLLLNDIIQKISLLLMQLKWI
jgi:hypothetical protein